MQRRRGAGPRREDDHDGVGAVDEHAAPVASATATTPATPAPVLRKPRHGGWKGTEPRREDQLLRGEPGYNLGGYLYQVGIDSMPLRGAIEMVV